VKIYLMKNLVLLTIILLANNFTEAQKLTIVDQNYDEALRIATEEDKMIFVDFYTTWCGPCKKMDKLIFQNDSVQRVLGEHFILLKYDAENDTTHHLSKKYHIRSYPTGLILNDDGYVLNRKYGFPGEDFLALLQSVTGFTEEAIELNKRGEVVKGYSNEIDVSAYPGFYIDYVNRENTKIDSLEFETYWKGQHDVFSEEYFATLLYFAGQKVPERIADAFLKSKPKYVALFGESDVNIALMFLSYDRFDAAIADKDRTAFDLAVEWVKSALPEKWAGQVASNAKAEFEKEQKD
jgi:thiol-disulfide isomerase/thioredoxin